MLRWLTNFFQYLFELISAPFRIAGMWRQHSAYDEHGYFNFLKGREEDPEAFQIEGVTQENVDKALSVFCEAFDIMPVQKYCLRPDDKITTLYCAMVTGCWDEQEMERLCQRLEAETGVSLTQTDLGQFDTLEDLVQWYNRNNREARAAREVQEAAAAAKAAEEQEAAQSESREQQPDQGDQEQNAPEASRPESQEQSTDSNGGGPKRKIQQQQPEPSRSGEGLSF